MEGHQTESATDLLALTPLHCGRLSRVYAAWFDLFAGTLAPFFRASERPIATACFRLFTFPPLPLFPERRVPLFSRRIALATVLLAALPYFLDFELFLRAGMYPPCYLETGSSKRVARVE